MVIILNYGKIDRNITEMIEKMIEKGLRKTDLELVSEVSLILSASTYR